MKTKLLIIALVSLLYSCNLFRNTTTEISKKKDIKTETEVSKKAEEKTELKKDSSANTDTKIEHYATKKQIDKMIAEWSENYTVYDTSKPVDKTTGKPPIQSERIINYKSDKQTNKTIKENSTVDNKQEINLKVDSSIQKKSKKESLVKTSDKSETETSTSIPWWKWLVVGMIITLFVGMVLKLRDIFV